MIYSGSLKDLLHLARLANANLVSVGASLGHAHVPGRAAPEEEVPPDEVEVGMGIHNEPGSQRVKASLEELITLMLRQLLDTSDPDRAFLRWYHGDEFVLMINNLGSLSVAELSSITGEVAVQLDKTYKIRPVRAYQGTFLTSLNSPGFSISLLRITHTGLKQSFLELLDAPAEAIGWSAPVNTDTWKLQNAPHVSHKKTLKAHEVPSNVTGMLYP